MVQKGLHDGEAGQRQNMRNDRNSQTNQKIKKY